MSNGALAISECVCVAVFVFVLNWQARRWLKYDLTAAADFVLAILAFDFTAMIAGDGFSAAVRSGWFREHFVTVMGLLFIVTFIAWSLGSLRLEKVLDDHYGVPGERNVYFGISWTLVAFLLGLNIYTFVAV